MQAGPFQMEIGSYCVDFVEAESLIESQGAIKSTHLETDGTLAHHGFSLELADQSASDSSTAVLWQDREVR
jgi:hypothetical protein